MYTFGKFEIENVELHHYQGAIWVDIAIQAIVDKEEDGFIFSKKLQEFLDDYNRGKLK